VTGFLAELGKKLTDRWLDALVLPGLLWVATLTTALRLGQTHPFDLVRLRGWLDQLAAHPAVHTLGTVVLAATGILLACAAAGLAAVALGGLLQRLWVLPGTHPPSAWLLRWRQHRWDTATRQLKTAIACAAHPAAHGAHPARATATLRRSQHRRTRLGTHQPTRPTRTGDRLHHTAARLAAHNGLDDLPLIWPRLWSVLPDPLRADLAAARDSYTAAARLAAWALLYTALTALWWPAAALGLVTLATALTRARTSFSALSDLVETAADLHARDLADRLGIPSALPPIETGQAISTALRTALRNN
jgi:hypothetical protein